MVETEGCPLDGCTLLPTKEIAARLGVTTATVRDWMHDGKLPYVRMGVSNKVTIADLTAFVESRKKRGRRS